jgi:hypothetical protein
MRFSSHTRPLLPVLLLLIAASFAPAQVIEFESGGLKYQTLSRDGLTIMFAALSTTLNDYAIIQVAISNGSENVIEIEPEDFYFEVPGYGLVQAASPRTVVRQLTENPRRSDIVKLIGSYELSLYGMGNFRISNSYEERRRSAIADTSFKKIKAAAAASAICFGKTKLASGESTDGAVFFPIDILTARLVKLKVNAGGREYEFLPSQVVLSDSQ